MQYPKRKKPVGSSTLDSLWSRAVKTKCGAVADTESHHIIRRAHYCTRWDWRNGIALTHEEHRRAHAGPLEFAGRMAREWPYYDYLVERSKILKPDFLRMLGMTEREYREAVKKELQEIIKQSDFS